MNETKKPTALEESIRRTLWRRRAMVAVGITVFLAVFLGAGLMIWQKSNKPKFVPPSYDLDPASETYWRDRTQADIDAVPKDVPSARRIKIVHPRLRYTVSSARKLDSNYQRIMALSDIALTMAANDENYSIDNVLRDLGETPLALGTYGRILISQALMHLRLDNPSAARVAFQEYRRIMLEADLKLDSDINVLSFIGAVNVLSVFKDRVQLTEMFNLQFNYTLRVIPSQRGAAFRILAGEQARVGMTIPAMNTVRRIENPVELCRAYQLIIALSARPPEIKPVEPEFERVKTEGPWTPELQPVVARQVIDDVFAQIAQKEELDTQINLLMRLAGSKLMCDPEIYRIFKEAVEQSSFDELIRRPVVKLLNEPESDIIRVALGMPKIDTERRRNVDPAADDWDSPYGTVSVDLLEIAPDMVKTLSDVQLIRTLLMTAQSYQMVARYKDAGDVLRRAAPVAQGLPHPIDRITYLLLVAEKQISAGRIGEAGETLRSIGLPPVGDKAAPPEAPSEVPSGMPSEAVFTPDRLSTMARLQSVARFFDDALATISRMETSDRNDDLEFLALEQIRIQQFDAAGHTVSQMQASASTERLRHLIAIGQGGGEEHYTAVKIPFPGSQNRDIDLRRSCESLFREGLYSVAATAAAKIADREARSILQQRIAQEYMLLFAGYRGDDEPRRRVRDTLLHEAYSLAEKIEVDSRKAELLESILRAALPYAKSDESRTFLAALYENALAACRRLDSNAPEKAELFGKLLLDKLELEAHGKVAIPLDAVMPMVTETLGYVNAAKDGPQRGNALSSLAMALVRIGRDRDAQKMVEEARETARKITPARDAVSVLLSLVPALRLLDDGHTVQQVYHSAFTIASDSFTASTLDTEKLYEWRVRDSELDRIARSQLENGFLTEAVEYAVRIEENLLRERLFRTAIYIYLDRGEIEPAESLLQRIKLPEIRTDTARDLLFMKRRAEKAAEAGEKSNE